MKKILIIIAFLIIGTESWAQSNTADENAIKKVLEKESEAAQNRNYEEWIKCFAPTPDVAFGFSHLLPTYMVRGYDELAEIGKKVFSENLESSFESFEFTDFKIRINGTSAFVTYNQTNSLKDGTKVRYYKAEYLEKINNEWKMIGHIFLQEPKPDTRAEK
ncbi:MAG TPA: nuclear transport factor 2 family protein [Anditalea sp.]|nr:nuclear transport factor 2 family protein [Anditalea sp.]